MPRNGMKSERKSRDSNMKGPDSGSKTSRRRKNAGFESLEKSSRIHKRAMRKQLVGRFFNGKLHEPGEKAECASGPNPRTAWLYVAAGAFKYH